MTTQPSTTNVLDNAPPEDWELVALVHTGGEAGRDAFGTLYTRHHDKVYRYILYRLDHHDRDLAEQMTGEVWVRALHRIHTVHNRRNGQMFGAWVITIARNLILDHVKSARHRWDRSVPVVPEPLSRSGNADTTADGGVVAKLTTEFYARHLITCLRRLPPDQRDCIGMRFYAGMSVAETAVAMNRNVSAVKALQHRAVRGLARLLPDGAASWLAGDYERDRTPQRKANR